MTGKAKKKKVGTKRPGKRFHRKSRELCGDHERTKMGQKNSENRKQGEAKLAEKPQPGGDLNQGKNGPARGEGAPQKKPTPR